MLGCKHTFGLRRERRSARLSFRRFNVEVVLDRSRRIPVARQTRASLISQRSFCNQVPDWALHRCSEVGRLTLAVMVCGTEHERFGLKHHRGIAMDHYVGIDASLELSGVCLLDPMGQFVREAEVACEP